MTPIALLGLDFRLYMSSSDGLYVKAMASWHATWKVFCRLHNYVS